MNVRFEVADFLSWRPENAAFDFVTSLATLHHVPLDDGLERLKEPVRPGGVLAVLDLYRPTGIDGVAADAVGVIANLALRRIHTGHFHAPSLSDDARRAAAEHARHDVYPSLAQVRAVCDRVLPGARIRRHVLWRYSIVWQRHERRNSL